MMEHEPDQVTDVHAEFPPAAVHEQHCRESDFQVLFYLNGAETTVMHCPPSTVEGGSEFVLTVFQRDKRFPKAMPSFTVRGKASSINVVIEVFDDNGTRIAQHATERKPA